MTSRKTRRTPTHGALGRLKTSKRPEREVVSPSELLVDKRSGSVCVGGRVVDVRGNTVTLADALGGVAVQVDSAEGVRAGDLVMVEGRRGRRGLVSGRVVDRRPGRAPAAGSELARLAGEGVGRNLALRALALRVTRDFFDDRGFLEVETPVRVTSPGLDAYVDAVSAEDYWLITSPELAMKRLLVGGLPRVYQLARVNRAGEHGAWHEGEFTMLEWYRAFSTMDAVVADTEALVPTVVRALAGKPTVRRAGGKAVNVGAPFARTTVREAFRKYAGVSDAADLAATDPDRYFQVLVDSVEPGLARLDKPVVVTEFPSSQGALARACPHDATVSERFEVYVAGLEVCNGFGELTDPVEQRRRFEVEQDRRKRAGAPGHPIDERFLAALAEGMPPSGGNALGFDRLVALAIGVSGVAPVMAFPRERL